MKPLYHHHALDKHNKKKTFDVDIFNEDWKVNARYYAKDVLHLPKVPRVHVIECGVVCATWYAHKKKVKMTQSQSPAHQNCLLWKRGFIFLFHRHSSNSFRPLSFFVENHVVHCSKGVDPHGRTLGCSIDTPCSSHGGCSSSIQCL